MFKIKIFSRKLETGIGKVVSTEMNRTGSTPGWMTMTEHKTQSFVSVYNIIDADCSASWPPQEK